MFKRQIALILSIAFLVTFNIPKEVVGMANKYANLDGSKNIKDEYGKINDGFDKVEEDIESIITGQDLDPNKDIELLNARGGDATLGNRLNKIDSILKEKANQDYTDIELFNKRDKSILIGMGDLAQEVKEGMTGGSVAVVGVDSILEKNLTDGAVSTRKTSYLNKTYNLFNAQNITIGKNIDETTGEVTDSPIYSISEYIEVEPNTEYHINNLSAFRRYDENKNYISGTANLTGTFNSLSAKYIRIRILNREVYNYTMVKAEDSNLDYIESGYLPETENTPIQLKQKSNNEVKHFESYERKYNAPIEVLDVLNNATNIRTINNQIVIRDNYVVKWKDRLKSIQLDIPSSDVGSLIFERTSPLDLMGVSEFVAIIYIEDVTKINNINFRMADIGWERPPVGYSGSLKNGLKNGWNIIRYQTSSGDTSTWTNSSNFRLDVYPNSPTTVYVSDIVAIKPEKAKILIINDHGYSNFKNVAYPQLKELGIPVTWAINPGRLGAPITNVESILTQEEIDELAYDPYSEFSYHAWDPTENHSGNMTAEELLEEHHKSTTYLKKNGLLPRYYWRAAFTTNRAPAHEVLQSYLDAYATYKENGSTELYPFRDNYNINRDLLHSRSNEYMDSRFDILKKTGGVYVCYTHGLDDSGGIHITTDEFNYLLFKIEEGVNEGWLEGTTYNKLRGKYGFEDYSDIL